MSLLSLHIMVALLFVVVIILWGRLGNLDKYRIADNNELRRYINEQIRAQDNDASEARGDMRDGFIIYVDSLAAKLGYKREKYTPLERWVKVEQDKMP